MTATTKINFLGAPHVILHPTTIEGQREYKKGRHNWNVTSATTRAIKLSRLENSIKGVVVVQQWTRRPNCPHDSYSCPALKNYLLLYLLSFYSSSSRVWVTSCLKFVGGKRMKQLRRTELGVKLYTVGFSFSLSGLTSLWVFFP